VDDSRDRAGEPVFELSYKRSRCCDVVPGPVTEDLLRTYQADMVIVAIPSLSRDKFGGVVRAAEATGAEYAFVPSQSVRNETWVNYTDIDGLLLGSRGTPAANHVYDSLKRVLDVLGASLLLVALSPILLLIAALIRLDSPGPALFRQRRVGQYGRLFSIYKFRSMQQEAPAYAYSPRVAQDPRITHIGRFLRRTSLDELPQLINVLKGHMSLVGPRPEMPFIVQQYSERHQQRLEVKPGITGLWQISADREFLIHENIQYDLYYIQNRSLFMDIAILLHTAVFAMRGV
jgi:exopolysaccharide biosynthesis polyprenyl glycosylphosphotransferase